MKIKEEVLQSISREGVRQDEKWGECKPQSLPGYMLIMKNELAEAENAWTKNSLNPNQSCLEEILQVVTVGIRCLEFYGTVGSAVATNDKIVPSYPKRNSAPYGHCPVCFSPGKSRERRLNGNDVCEKGHTYPSKDAVK